MRTSDKPVVWLHGEVKSPPFSVAARVEAGALLRRLQRGERLQMPVSRPMSQIGARVHELRIVDGSRTWRVVYRTDPDAIVVAEVFGKTTRQTPVAVLRTCQRRFRAYDAASTAED
jgi:phage-related protein